MILTSAFQCAISVVLMVHVSDSLRSATPSWTAKMAVMPETAATHSTMSTTSPAETSPSLARMRVARLVSASPTAAMTPSARKAIYAVKMVAVGKHAPLVFQAHHFVRVY